MEKFGTPHQPAAVLFHRRSHAIHVLEPAGGAHHHRQFHRRQFLDIGERRFRRGELDRHIRARSLGEIIIDIDGDAWTVKPYSGASCSISLPIFP